jgi:hypothetical protein
MRRLTPLESCGGPYSHVFRYKFVCISRETQLFSISKGGGARVTMSVILASTAGFVVLLGITFTILLKKLSPSGKAVELPGDWDKLYSASRYKPMERLLDREDYRFVSSQAVNGRGLARRLRASRIAIFRGYARCLARDFSRVSCALRVLMVHAQVDRSPLAGLLIKQQLQFNWNMMSLEVRLALHGLGWTAPELDISNLVDALDSIGAQLRALAVTVQPAATVA